MLRRWRIILVILLAVCVSLFLARSFIIKEYRDVEGFCLFDFDCKVYENNTLYAEFGNKFYNIEESEDSKVAKIGPVNISLEDWFKGNSIEFARPPVTPVDYKAKCVETRCSGIFKK